MKVALVTAAHVGAQDTDMPPLVAALERRGVHAETAVWDDPKVRWSGFDAAVIRSTWDYALRRDQFVEWARTVSTRLLNDSAVLGWNTDKRYLAELAARGVPITPTSWIARDDAIHLPDGEIVVKPAVSAGARDTARYAPEEHDAARAHVRALTSAGRLAMVQPYQRAVDKDGESGLVFFGGTFSHATHKHPVLERGVRPSDELSAPTIVGPRIASPKERALAEAVLDAVPMGRASLAYARVDIVTGNGGEPMLLELELTEPSVYLDLDAGAADRFAAAILERLS